MKNRIPALLAVLLLAFVMIIPAQTGVQKSVVTKVTKLPTAQDLSSALKREPARFAVMSPTAKLKLVNDIFGEKGLPKVSSLTPALIYTSTNPKLSDTNFLTYFKPWNVLAMGDAVQFSPAKFWQDSSLVISYKPPATGFYALELSVKRTMETEFTALTPDGKNTQTLLSPMSAEKFVNIVFLFNFADTNPKSIIVYANRDWSFYKCDLSQVK